jgi:phage protein D
MNCTVPVGDGITVNLAAASTTGAMALQGAAISFNGSTATTTSVGAAANGQIGFPRLINLDLLDNRGIEADQLTLSLSDHDGLLAITPKGAIIRFWLGWSDTGLVDKGTYTVDETDHSSAPDVLSIRARSADFRKSLKTKRERSWSNTTLGDVLGDIAQGTGLTATIAGALHGLPILQLDQANESDANLISRIGEEFDAVVTIKAGRLLCLPAGGGQRAAARPPAPPNCRTLPSPAPTAISTATCKPTATATTACVPTSMT